MDPENLYVENKRLKDLNMKLVMALNLLKTELFLEKDLNNKALDMMRALQNIKKYTERSPFII
jgi:hypothetical protein